MREDERWKNVMIEDRKKNATKKSESKVNRDVNFSPTYYLNSSSYIVFIDK